jgi:hypothetical protein
VWTVGGLVIEASVVAHGMTDAPLTKLYGKRVNDAPEDGLDGRRGEVGRDRYGARRSPRGRAAGTPGTLLG